MNGLAVIFPSYPEFNMAEATVTARHDSTAQKIDGLPAPKAAEKTPNVRLDELKKALSANVAARAKTISRIAALAEGSQDRAFRNQCADAIGSFMTADGTSTTDREFAAKTLGAVNSSKAVDYLGTALSDGISEGVKYPTTVRVAAVHALIWQTSLPMGEDRTREHAMEIIRAVAEKDRYDPRREAKRFLDRLEEMKRKNKES